MSGLENKIKPPKIRNLVTVPALSSHSMISNYFHHYIFHSKYSLDKFFGKDTSSVWTLWQLLKLMGNLSIPLFSGDDCIVLCTYIAHWVPVTNWYRPVCLRYGHEHNSIIVNIMILWFHQEYLHDHFERFIGLVFIWKLLPEN